MSKKETKNTGPVETLRDGALKATIWRNEGKKDGESYVFFTAEISRTYKDDAGNYHDGHSMSAIQLLKVSHLAEKAYDRIRKLEHAERVLADDDQEGAS